MNKLVIFFGLIVFGALIIATVEGLLGINYADISTIKKHAHRITLMACGAVIYKAAPK